MHRYMSRLDQALKTQRPGIKYMHSGGGVIPARTAERFPIQLLYSGPAAGVLADGSLPPPSTFPTCARSTWAEPASMFA